MSDSAGASYLPFMEAAPAGRGLGSGGSFFRWRLGIRPLDLRDWIELGSDVDEPIAEKARLSREHPDTVYAVLDDVEQEAREVAAAIVDHLRRRGRSGTVRSNSTLRCIRSKPPACWCPRILC